MDVHVTVPDLVGRVRRRDYALLLHVLDGNLASSPSIPSATETLAVEDRITPAPPLRQTSSESESASGNRPRAQSQLSSMSSVNAQRRNIRRSAERARAQHQLMRKAVREQNESQKRAALSSEDLSWLRDPRWFAEPQSTMQVSVSLTKVGLDLVWGAEDTAGGKAASGGVTSRAAASRSKASEASPSEDRIVCLDIVHGSVSMAQIASDDELIHRALREAGLDGARERLDSTGKTAAVHAKLDAEGNCWKAPAMDLTAALQDITGSYDSNGDSAERSYVFQRHSSTAD